jgi:hypothetical protein
MKKKLAMVTVVFIVLQLLAVVASGVRLALADNIGSTSKNTIAIQTRCANSMMNGNTTYPSLAPSAPDPNFPTHWYAGSIYPLSLATQNATSICASIDVPNSAPSSEEFYYVILSCFDSNGSYDQLGFCANNGAWELDYCWTAGDPSLDSSYHNHPNSATLSQGTTYTFNITVQNGFAYFVAYQGSTLIFSEDAPTGGNYLILSNDYFEYGQFWVGYTDYEEVYDTTTAGGAPGFNFYFHDQYWVATNGSTYAPTWTIFTTANWPYAVSPFVAVVINGDSVLVMNLGVDITVNSVVPVPPHYSVFQVYHHGMRLNGQNISMSYTVTVTRTDNDSSVPLLYVEVGLNRTNVNNASDCRIIGTGGVLLGPAPGGNSTGTFTWNETNTMNPGNYSITGFANSLTNNTFDMNPSDNQLTNDTVQAKELPGDVNGNGIVDIYDAIMLANSWGKLENQTGYNPDANFSSAPDGSTGLQIIDIYDALILATHFDWDIYGPRSSGRSGTSPNGGMQAATTGTPSVVVDLGQIIAFKGEVFTVNVKVTSVTDLLGWEFKLYWNSALLNCTDFVIQTPTEWQGNAHNYGEGLEAGYNATHARLWIAQAANYPAPSFNGSMTIATLTFQALQTGTTPLTLADTKLGNSTGQPMDHADSGGSVSVYYGRYMRSDAKSVNGLNAYLLNVTRTTTGLYQSANANEPWPVTWGIRAWVRHSNGTEQEIALDGQTGTPKAQVSRSSGYGMQSNTVSVTQRSMQATDSLVVRVYMDIGGGGWTLAAAFTTEQLGATTLTGTTWTVYYYTWATYNRITDKTYGRYYWGDSAHDSRIQNLQYG